MQDLLLVLVSVLATAVLGLAAYMFTRQSANTDRQGEKREASTLTLTEVVTKVEGHDREFREVKRQSEQANATLEEFRRSVDERFERQAAKIAEGQRQHSDFAGVAAAGFARMEATLQGVMASIDRLTAAEQSTRAAPAPQPGFGNLDALMQVMTVVSKFRELGFVELKGTH